MGARELTVVAEPADEVAMPGQDTAVTVTVTNASGVAVAGAEVTLIVVDDAVLSLAGYTLKSPIAEFYPYRSACSSTVTSLALVQLLSAEELEEMKVGCPEQ